MLLFWEYSRSKFLGRGKVHFVGENRESKVQKSRIFVIMLSGSVYWYFVLLNYVKDEDLAGCSTACAALLTAVSRQLQYRLTPMEALLQTRYRSIGDG